MTERRQRQDTPLKGKPLGTCCLHPKPPLSTMPSNYESVSGQPCSLGQRSRDPTTVDDRIHQLGTFVTRNSWEICACPNHETRLHWWISCPLFVVSAPASTEESWFSVHIIFLEDWLRMPVRPPKKQGKSFWKKIQRHTSILLVDVLCLSLRRSLPSLVAILGWSYQQEAEVWFFLDSQF